MTDVQIDTLAMVRKLKDSGFNAQQAEAVTEAVRTGVTGGVATKTDLAELKVDLEKLETKIETDLEKLETMIETDLEKLEVEIKTDMKWIKAIGGVIIALLAVPLLRELIMAMSA